MANMARYGQILSDIPRYGRIWLDIARYGHIWSDMVKYGYKFSNIPLKVVDFIWTRSLVNHIGIEKDFCLNFKKI